MLRRLGTARIAFNSFELKAYGLTYMLQGGELSPHLEAMPKAKDPKIGDDGEILTFTFIKCEWGQA